MPGKDTADAMSADPPPSYSPLRQIANRIAFRLIIIAVFAIISTVVVWVRHSPSTTQPSYPISSQPTSAYTYQPAPTPTTQQYTYQLTPTPVPTYRTAPAEPGQALGLTATLAPCTGAFTVSLPRGWGFIPCEQRTNPFIEEFYFPDGVGGFVLISFTQSNSLCMSTPDTYRQHLPNNEGWQVTLCSFTNQNTGNPELDITYDTAYPSGQTGHWTAVVLATDAQWQVNGNNTGYRLAGQVMGTVHY